MQTIPKAVRGNKVGNNRIRRACEKDIQRVAVLLRQVLEVHADGRPDIFVHGKRKYTDEELRGIFADPSKPVFVAVDSNDSVTGYAFCIFEETKGANCLHDMKTLYIDDICVDETLRRQHIATDLYNYVIAFAKENGCYHVTLNVWTSNPDAQRFYEAMGMKPLKTMMETIL